MIRGKCAVCDREIPKEKKKNAVTCSRQCSRYYCNVIQSLSCRFKMVKRKR